jgi:heme oxygenase
MARLRFETKPFHDRIERDLDLMRADITRRDYFHLLSRLHGYYAPWEAIALPTLQSRMPGFYEVRLKTPKLVRDLKEGGLNEEQIGALPRCENLPALDSVTRVLGSLYVLEGATLGGQFIARHLEERLGFHDGIGYSFFRSYGADVGRMWRSFAERVNEYSRPDTDDEIVRSAMTTFQTMQEWLVGQ